MRIKILILSALTIMTATKGTYAQIEHIEPPFWWTGMKHSGLQLMVHGEDIAGSSVSIDYEGVSLKSAERTGNNNYLFINLDISPETEPGSFRIQFTDDRGNTVEKEYKLLEREPGSAERKGFDSTDVMYLIMPDRFANGDPSNDEVEGMKEGLNRRKRYGRHGGDIKGIYDHLDYIADMGFTAIWLNPVLENDMKEWSYHGYAATDFYNVDRRFGTNEDYVELISAAKEKGMKVIGLTGKNGGKMADLCDILINTPEAKFSDRIQEIHIKVIHIMILLIEAGLAK